MNIKPIRNDDDLRAAFARLETVFQAPEGSPEANEMEALVALVESYENKHYPVGPADPIEAIKFRMEQQAGELNYQLCEVGLQLPICSTNSWCFYKIHRASKFVSDLLMTSGK